MEVIELTDTINEMRGKVNGNFEEVQEIIEEKNSEKFEFTTPTTEWVCTHNMDSDSITVSVFDESGTRVFLMK